MADLTITVAVTTGTQYVTGSTSNIFTFDGSQPTDFTFPWVEDGTVRLDQSGSSNDGHPLIFSTSNSTTLGTMQAGIISSGVTYYLDGSSTESDYTNTTTFNAATTRYIEITPASATDFYFACWVHGIGMGGIVDITQTTWGALGYGYSNWSGSLSLTGVSATLTLGTPLVYPEQGWGRDTWGYENWGESALTVSITGVSATVTLGPICPGWGELAWNNSDYGWGYPVIPEQQMGLTGVSATASVGAPTVTPETLASLTGVSATTSVGSIVIAEGIPLTGVSATTSVGTLTAVADNTTTLTGVSATTDIGAPQVTSNPTVAPTGVSATTAVGAITPADQVMGLTGVSATSSVGAIVPADQVMGLTGVSATISVGILGIQHFQDIDTGSNTSYSNVATGSNTTYTDVDTEAA
jgi:hypothetical protein